MNSEKKLRAFVPRRKSNARMKPATFSRDPVVDDDSCQMWTGQEAITLAHSRKHADYRFILELRYTEYFSKEYAEEKGQYWVRLMLCVDDPKTLPAHELLGFRESMSLQFAPLDSNASFWCNLCDHGLCATLLEVLGDNRDRLLTEARKLARELVDGQGVHVFLDQPANKVGNNYWDFMYGTIGANQGAARKNQSREARLCRKIEAASGR